jgi:hypothetical protein
MKDRGWPHAQSTTRSTDATIAIGRERGRHRPQEGRDKARHHHTGAAAERPVSRGGGSSRTSPTLPPHTPCARVPSRQHPQLPAEPVGRSQLPSPPPTRAGRHSAIIATASPVRESVGSFQIDLINSGPNPGSQNSKNGRTGPHDRDPMPARSPAKQY